VVTIDDIRAAARRIRNRIVRTPLLEMKHGPREGIFLKCENLQRTGAFKIRGAANRLARLPRSCRGVTASSSGNHAQAVACAARERGLKACIVMLDQAVPHKVEGTRAYGAEVILGGADSVAITDRALRIAEERDWTFVSPFDHPDIIAGQGTAGLEIAEDLPDVRAVLVQIGGGGLISGVATAVKALCPRARIIGVEPEGAPTMSRAVEAGRVVRLDSVDTVADGLKPLEVGPLTLEHVQARVDDLVRVTDAEILDAAQHLLLREKLVVEPSGATALAALRSGRVKLPRGPVAVMLSGGNADVARVLAGAGSRGV
jgi:threonine dehydratase